MLDIAAIEEAEQWTGAGVVAGVILLLLVIVLLFVVIRRFLRD